MHGRSPCPPVLVNFVEKTVDQAFDSTYHWGIEYDFTWDNGKNKILPKVPSVSYKQITRTKSNPHVLLTALDNSTMHLEGKRAVRAKFKTSF